MQSLTHLTMQTDHRIATSRLDVDDAVIAFLDPIIRGGGGVVPPGFTVSMVRLVGADGRPTDGLAAFTVQMGPGGRALANNVVCWRDAAADDAWTIATGGGALLPPSGRPDAPPWLATMICDGLAVLPPDEIPMLADLERCIAWTLIEATP